eukprot:g16628.t1
MFGKGIYFADCPLKSWRYCFPSQEMANTLPRITGKGGYILMCWVDLGTTRQEKVAKPDLKGYNRKSWWNWITRCSVRPSAVNWSASRSLGRSKVQ